MAKDFDATLSQAIDLAAGAAQGPGATAARIRGGRRTRRKRVALSATSFMLVAAVSTAAFALSSSNRGATPQPPAATTSTPPTTAPTSTPATVPSSTDEPATNTPPTSTSGTSGASITSGTSTSTSSASSAPPTSSGTSASAPPAVITTTSLSPDQVPFYSLANWSDTAPLDCTGSLVFSVDASDNCPSYKSVGNAHAAQKVTVIMYGSSGLAVGFAYQDFFTYANAADAQAAFQSLTQGLLADGPLYNGAIDPSTNLPMVSTTTITAQRTGSMAIYHKLRDNNGAPGRLSGLNGGASDRHFYCTVRGNVMAIVVAMGDPSMSNTSNDKTTLAAVAGTLT